MAPADGLDDAAVARLLAEDARSASSRYASQGLSALLPRRMNGGAPKPNTRFLKNLVRDADTHNAALRRKEEQERQQRLRQLNESGGRPEAGQRGDRLHGEGHHERKRRRLDNREDEHEHERIRRKHRSNKHRPRNTSSERSLSRSRSRSQEREDRQRHEHRGREVSGDGGERRHAHRKHHRRRTPPPSPAHVAVTKFPKEHVRRLDSRSGLSRSPAERASSDPLEDLVGPLPASKPGSSPPVRSRGRGAHKVPGSVMDSHFSATYDPTLDVHPDSEDSAEREDWDMALEALRDRQQWKRKQADRMRETGFGDDEIKKWEDSDKVKSARDLEWRKAGEGREWDAGKSTPPVEEHNGRLSRKADSDLEASWKRKSGGLLKDLESALR